jgi:hypothetical protein
MTAEWTIMVFLNAKNNLEEYSFPNFKQMARVGSTDAVNILVEYGRPRRHYSDNYGGWSKTLRFRVEKGMEPLESRALEDLGKVNMGSGAALSRFVRWSKEKYPAKRYLLAIWDHGQGWRLDTATRFPGTREEVDGFRSARRGLIEQAVETRGEVPGPEEDQVVSGTFRYVSHDEDTGDKLYNREIQDALTRTLHGEKLDIIAFDACLMAMVETAYAMRKVAKVMVGSEELEPGSGWNYQRWLAPLVAAPGDFDGAELGKQMVKAYGDFYQGDYDTTLSAIDVSKSEELGAAITAFADLAKSKLSAQLAVLKRARGACASYAPGYGVHSIDLCRYLDQFQGADVDPDLRNSAMVASDVVRKAVLANYAADTRQDRFGSNGLAIYYPPTKKAFEADPDGDGYLESNTHYPVEFVKKESWAKFMHAYLDALAH